MHKPKRHEFRKAGVALIVTVVLALPLAAQEKEAAGGGKPVDQTKLLLGEIYRLGDPTLNKMLPDLYWALKATEEEAPADWTPRKESTGMPNVMSMLLNPSVRREIEMLDHQYVEVKEKHAGIVRSMNEEILAMLNSTGGADPNELREKILAIRSEAEKEVEKAVLPTQFERLQQLRYYLLIRRLGAVNVLTKDPLAAELGISDEQKQELREAAREIDEELEREIAELRSKAMGKLFSKLKKDQQAKLAEIIGDQFHYQQVDPKKR